MKRTYSSCLMDNFEITPFKIPRLNDDQEEPLKFFFTPTKQQTAALNYIKPWVINFIKENRGDRKLVKAFASGLHNNHDLSPSAIDLLLNMICEIEERIAYWVTHIDLYIFNTTDPESSRILDIIDCIEWTTKGTINYYRSAVRLLDLEDLTNEDKLKIVCVHCLTEHIERYMQLANADNLPNLFEKTEEIVDFWRKCVANINTTGNFDGIEVDEKLLDNFGYANGHVVMFIWDRLNESARATCLLKLMEYGDIDLQCDLLSRLDKDQQLEVFAKCGSSILNNMMQDFVWDRYLFLTIHFARDVISNDDFYEVLNHASTLPHAFDIIIHKYKRLLPKLWQIMPSRVRDYICSEKYDINLLNAFMQNFPNADDIKNVFLKLSPTMQRSILESVNGSEVCAELIASHEEYEFVDSLLNNVFGNAENISAYKKNLCDHTGGLMYSIKNMKSLDKLEVDLKWFAPIKSEAIEYKRKCVSRLPVFCATVWFNDILFSKSSIYHKPRDNADFSKINALLEWSGLSPFEIQDTKQKMIENVSHSNSHYIFRLIKLEKYELVEQLLHWCLPDLESIYRYKELTFEIAILPELVDFVYNLLWKDDDLTALSKYVVWNFPSDYEESKFKQLIMEECGKPTSKLLGSLLFAEKMELADKFLHWCGIYDKKELQEFKDELLLVIEPGYITKRVGAPHLPAAQNCETRQLLKRVFKIIDWFDPSDEVFAKYEKKYSENKSFYRFMQLFKEF